MYPRTPDPKPILSAEELADAVVEHRTALLAHGLDEALVNELLVVWFNARCLNAVGFSLIKQAIDKKLFSPLTTNIANTVASTKQGNGFAWTGLRSIKDYLKG